MFRDYRNCMFRSEWLNDAKFKSLVANDGTDWCLKVCKGQSQGKPKAKVHFLGSDSVTDRVNVTDTDSDSDTDSGSDNDSAVRMSELRFLFVTL